MSHVALLQVILAQGAGDAVVKRIAKLSQATGTTADDIVGLPSRQLSDALKISEDVSLAISNSREGALALQDKLWEQGIELLWINDARYPIRVRATLGEDAPPLLFARGNLELLRLPAVGFCGSRHASDRGLRVTETCARALAREHVCVVSGYAHGVDTSAHRASLDEGGSTILVLVDGILRFEFKREIVDLVTMQNHLVISQFPPCLTWQSHNAMKRNLTIIGLCDALILVESRMKGGTFAAGTAALEHRHPLFVIDFADPGPTAEANPYFIKRGGAPIRGNRQQVPNLNQVLTSIRQPRRDQDRSDLRLL